MATVAVFDYFLTLGDEVRDLQTGILGMLTHQCAGQLRVEETKLMYILRIPSGPQRSLSTDGPDLYNSNVYRTGIPSYCSSSGNK